MKVRVRDIRLEGLEVTEDVVAETLGFEPQFDFKFIKPLHVEAKFERVDSTVLVYADVNSRYESVCARCLEPLEGDWEKHFNFDYQVDSTIEVIDIGDDIRQELFLNLPARILCQEKCKGLCVGCGVNLNNEKCKCK